MNLAFAVLILIGLVGCWWLVKKFNEPATSEATPSDDTLKKTNAFHAVSIRAPMSACDAAKEMAGRRILASAAPPLPLPECDMNRCGCRFIHHNDRRASEDRRNPFSPAGFAGSTGRYQVERRQGRDRRRASRDEAFF
jgi:hypothetical protein